MNTRHPDIGPAIGIGFLIALLLAAVMGQPAAASVFRGTQSSNYRPDDDMTWKGTVTDAGVVMDVTTHPEGGAGTFLRGVAIRNTSSGGPVTDVLYGDLGATLAAQVTAADWEVLQQAERSFEFFGTTLGIKAPPGRTINYEVVGLR